eukprot:GHVN01101901.1.p1 GENE.GHVN01101901.1~~GHVN01101901.1.p1  ORF type:complete len:293 (+),score=111.41 GHVN01101901.1:464-1342(+)
MPDLRRGSTIGRAPRTNRRQNESTTDSHPKLTDSHPTLNEAGPTMTDSINDADHSAPLRWVTEVECPLIGFLTAKQPQSGGERGHPGERSERGEWSGFSDESVARRLSSLYAPSQPHTTHSPHSPHLTSFILPTNSLPRVKQDFTFSSLSSLPTSSASTSLTSLKPLNSLKSLNSLIPLTSPTIPLVGRHVNGSVMFEFEDIGKVYTCVVQDEIASFYDVSPSLAPISVTTSPLTSIRLSAPLCSSLSSSISVLQGGPQCACSVLNSTEVGELDDSTAGEGGDGGEGGEGGE